MEDRGRRSALVMPFVPRMPSTTAGRPTGDPLPLLWQKWWAEYGIHHWSKPSSAKNARRCQQLVSVLGPHPSPSEVSVLLAALIHGGLGPRTVAMHRHILHGVYSFGNELGYCHGNPASRRALHWKAPPPAEPHPIRNIGEAWPLILRAFEADPARVRAFLGVLRFGGLRLEEALGLTPADVMRAGPVWRLSVVRQRVSANSMQTTTVKGKGIKSRRDFPIRPELVELLRPVLLEGPVQLRFGGGRWGASEVREAPFLFPYRSNNLEPLRARLGALFPEHFGPRRGWHTFRHTLAYEMRAAGKPVEAIQAVFGHKSVQTTEHYLSRLVGAHVGDDVFEGM